MNPAISQMSDGERVSSTANQLDTSEFEVFRLAYADWHGHEADNKLLEREFVQYLYFGASPPWVRNFTRNFLGQFPQHSPRAGFVRAGFVRAALEAMARPVLDRFSRFLFP